MATPTLFEAPSPALLAPRDQSSSAAASDDYTSAGAIFGWIWMAICSFWIWVPVTLFVLAFPYLFIRCLYRVTLGKLVGRQRARQTRRRNAREDVVKLVARRGEERRKWAKEELQLARKEGRSRTTIPYFDVYGDLECGGKFYL